MPLLRRTPKQVLTPEQKRQRAEASQQRMAFMREARAAVRGMQKPEPVRGLYVSIFLAAVAVYSYLSTDIETLTKTVNHKTVSYTATVQHPAAAVVLLVIAIAGAVSIYWKRRMVTGIAFMLGAALGIGTPLPKTVGGYQWAIFVVPAGYVLWMLICRMNKEQKAYMSKHRPAAAAAPPARSRAGERAPARTSRGRRKQEPVPTTPSGRPLPPPSRRYTPPKAKVADK